MRTRTGDMGIIAVCLALSALVCGCNDTEKRMEKASRARTFLQRLVPSAGDIGTELRFVEARYRTRNEMGAPYLAVERIDDSGERCIAMKRISGSAGDSRSPDAGTAVVEYALAGDGAATETTVLRIEYDLAKMPVYPVAVEAEDAGDGADGKDSEVSADSTDETAEDAVAADAPAEDAATEDVAAADAAETKPAAEAEHPTSTITADGLMVVIAAVGGDETLARRAAEVIGERLTREMTRNDEVRAAIAERRKKMEDEQYWKGEDRIWVRKKRFLLMDHSF